MNRIVRWLFRRAFADEMRATNERLRLAELQAFAAAEAVSLYPQLMKVRLDAHFDKLHAQLASAQAIDVNFRETGKVVVLCRIAGHDRVKIIDVKPEWRLKEYEEFCSGVLARYGTKVGWVDAANLEVQDGIKSRVNGQ